MCRAKARGAARTGHMHECGGQVIAGPLKLAGRPAGAPPDAPSTYQPACKPGSVRRTAEAAHVTAIPLARRLPGASSNLPERLIRTDPAFAAPRGVTRPRRSYSVLLPVGFAVPRPLPARAVRSYRTVSPLPRLIRNAPRRFVFCGTFPEVLPPPDVIRHRWSMEPGLSSPPAFRLWHGAAVRPTDRHRHGGPRRRRQVGRRRAKKPGPVEREQTRACKFREEADEIAVSVCEAAHRPKIGLKSGPVPSPGARLRQSLTIGTKGRSYALEQRGRTGQG